VAAAAAAVVAVLGAVALIAGYQTRIAAIVLALFTLVASFFFHNYWGVPAEQAFVQQLLFFKNVAVVGGLFVLAAFGAGAWSLDAKRGA
jgi:putative oxidoreductase